MKLENAFLLLLFVFDTIDQQLFVTFPELELVILKHDEFLLDQLMEIVAIMDGAAAGLVGHPSLWPIPAESPQRQLGDDNRTPAYPKALRGVIARSS